MVVVSFTAALAAAAGYALSDPVSRQVRYCSNHGLPNKMPAPNELFDLYFKKVIDWDELVKRMSFYGFDREKVDEYLVAMESLPPSNAVIEYRRHSPEHVETADQILEALRVRDRGAEVLTDVLKHRPDAQDLVRFGVREVANVDAQKLLNLMGNKPEGGSEYDDSMGPLEDQAAEIGLDIKYLKQYWMAHWQLPGIAQAMEMYRRLGRARPPLKFDETAFKEYLKYADVMPGFRDRIVEILQVLPTRVDLRRMWKHGIIEMQYERYKEFPNEYPTMPKHIASPFDMLVEYYRQNGYSAANAWALAWLAVEMADPADKDLTRVMILDLYTHGEVSREDTIKSLKKIRYDTEEAEYIVKLREADTRRKRLDRAIKRLEKAFAQGTLNLDTFAIKLAELNLHSAWEKQVLFEAIEDKNAAETLPSRTELKEFFQKGFNSRQATKGLLVSSGVSDSNAEKYLKLWEVEK